MTRSRRHFKLNAVRRHLIDKVPVSDLCDELGLQPTQIYQWQKMLFENGEAAFNKPTAKLKQDDAKDKKIQELEAKIQLKIQETPVEIIIERVQAVGIHRIIYAATGMSDTIVLERTPDLQ